MIPFLATNATRLAGTFWPDMLCRVPTDERVAYLTFDDGPTRTMTTGLIDLLDRFEAKATFFLVGAQAERHPGLVRALRDAGHTIGNHTYTHPDAWRTSADRLVTELERTTRVLEDLVGEPLRWMRPPYGRFTGTMRAWCRARRQRLTLWDVMPGDFLPSATSAGIQAHLDAYVRPGSVIVLHDNPRAEHVTPIALERVLTRLAGEGWRFSAL